MTKKRTRAANEPSQKRQEPVQEPAKVEETPFEAVASICSVLVVGLFILTFIAQIENGIVKFFLGNLRTQACSRRRT